jgi:hypothetical protein
MADETEELTEFEKLKTWFKADWEAWSPWYPEATLDYGFYAGTDQWDSVDQTRMKAANKPCVTFNRIGPSIDAVVGMEVSNRKEVTYLPRTTQQPRQPNNVMMPGQPDMSGADDQGPAELMKAAAQYVRDQCDAEDEESDAFQDTAICGVGWTETRVDYDEDPQGKIVIDRIDPMEMCADGRAHKRNLADARRMHRFREIDIRTAEKMFPGFEPEELDAAWARPIAGDTEPHDRELAREYANNRPSDGTPKRTVMVVHSRWYETQYTDRVVQSDGQVIEVDEDQMQVLRDRAKKTEVTLKVQRVGKRVFKYAFLGNAEVLESGADQCQYGFAWNCITGKRDRNAKQWVGIVRAMRDPQRWANALFSSIMDFIMHSGKGIMAEKGAFEDDAKAERDWAKQAKITFVQPGSLSGQNPKIQPKVGSALPPGIDNMMQFALSSLRDVTGINIETLGMADTDQAASLDRQRKQAASTLLAPFFDGLRRYRKDQGRLMMHLIKDYLNDGRLIRIVGPDYEGYVPLAMDPSVQEFDIIVEESPSSPNQKEASWAILQQMLPVLLKQPLSTEAWAKLLKASPLPLSVVDEFTAQMKKDQEEQAQQGPSPEDMKLLADAEKSKADAALKQQELEIRGVEAQLAFQGTQLTLQDNESQRRHDERMRGMELQGMEQEEFAKSAGAEMPAKFDAIANGLIQLGQGLQAGLTAQAEAIGQLAQATMASRDAGAVAHG